MTTPSIYLAVRNKLIAHEADRTPDGLLTLNNGPLFAQFLKLERAKRSESFDKVLEVVDAIDLYLASIHKRHVVVFAYMYLMFSDLTPRRRELDEELPDGGIRKTAVFDHAISDEAQLIGLWAKVRYDQLGARFLALVYSEH